MSPAQPPGPAPAVVPTAAVQEAQQASGEMRQWTSAAILGNGREALIEHVGAIYRLRLTSRGRLYLSK